MSLPCPRGATRTSGAASSRAHAPGLADTPAIDGVEHLRLNINNVYRTLMMVTPMALLMLVTMRSMFHRAGVNRVIAIASVVVFALSFWAMRTQAAVGDREFLRSMIPHHSGAILMCEQASLHDPDIIKLCSGIVQSQKAEIAEMERLLARSR